MPLHISLLSILQASILTTKQARVDVVNEKLNTLLLCIQNISAR